MLPQGAGIAGARRQIPKKATSTKAISQSAGLLRARRCQLGERVAKKKRKEAALARIPTRNPCLNSGTIARTSIASNCRIRKTIWGKISGAEWHVSALDSCSFQSVVTPTESKLWLDTTREGRGTSITASDGGPRAGYTGLLSQVRRKPIRHADSRTTTSILKFGA